MNHRQDLILKRDLLEKEAECIDEQGTQITKPIKQANNNLCITKLP